MKAFVKSLCYFACLIIVSPCLLVTILEAKLSNSEALFVAFSKLLSLVPGYTGCYLRRAFYRYALLRCGKELWIDFGSFFSHRGVDVGNNVYIGAYCIIGLARIESRVLIASRVSITSGRGQHVQQGDRAVKREAHFERCIVGQDSWIGEGAIVMANVGKESIVGAGSVVVADVSDSTTVAGNPARPLSRKKEGN